MEETVKRLEAKVVELEKKLSAVAPARAAPADITADEMKAFHKVRDIVAADFGDFCGINDCFRVTSRCITASHSSFRCIVRCINECVCGPCNNCFSGGGGVGGGGTFGGFGG
jgi:hypothetical protein